MLGKPDFISGETGAGGRWSLWAEREGNFYLGARRAVGRAREEGEALGRYGGSPDGSVTLRMDGKELRDMEIVVDAGR